MSRPVACLILFIRGTYIRYPVRKKNYLVLLERR